MTTWLTSVALCGDADVEVVGRPAASSERQAGTTTTDPGPNGGGGRSLVWWPWQLSRTHCGGLDEAAARFKRKGRRSGARKYVKFSFSCTRQRLPHHHGAVRR